jgi:hypothetical protein
VGVGISIVDETPQELMYITIEDIKLEYSNSSIAQNLECTIHKVQVNNQFLLVLINRLIINFKEHPIQNY